MKNNPKTLPVKCYIIGPSHIHKDFTFQIQNEINNKILFNNCILDAYCGIPIWSHQIYNSIKYNTTKGNDIIWIVSDYKFNNFNYDKIVKLQKNELFLNEIGHSSNVSHDFLDKHHIELLIKHSFKVIDFIVNTFPNIKLIFWCLYMRTKVNKNSSYPKYSYYDVIKKKYKKNIIDIDLFTNPKDFGKKVLDNGGHPNKDGFILLDKMIKSMQLVDGRYTHGQKFLSPFLNFLGKDNSIM